jgi:hypothetical protein
MLLEVQVDAPERQLDALEPQRREKRRQHRTVQEQLTPLTVD